MGLLLIQQRLKLKFVRLWSLDMSFFARSEKYFRVAWEIAAKL